MSRTGWGEINGAMGVPKPERRKRERAPKPRRPITARTKDQDRRKEHEALVRGPQWQACHALPCYACGAYRDDDLFAALQDREDDEKTILRTVKYRWEEVAEYLRGRR